MPRLPSWTIPRSFGPRASGAMALPFVAAALLAGIGCARRPDVGPVVVSAIGRGVGLADPSSGRPSNPERVFLGAVAQGLVRFDAAGQIEEGLAERWIVIEDGTSYIFRLRPARWPSGRRVTAGEVVAILKRAVAAKSRNPLAPYLTAIDDIVEMTPEVIEVRLARPRPDLLKLFAQPEMAVLRRRPPGGTGPFRSKRDGRNVLLVPAVDPERDPEQPDEHAAEDDVRLIGERAARAIARFAARQSDLVTGGTFDDQPILKAAELAPDSQRTDPATGLFGISFASRTGFLEDVANRAAIAESIDREALARQFGDDWRSAEQVLPDRLDSAAEPAKAPWLEQPIEGRHADARRRVTRWLADHPGGITLRIALPGGPGGTLLWGRVAADLTRIGITPRRVAMNDPAELRLIDAVAPHDNARWFLATACAPCGPEATQAIETARLASTLAERASAVATADALLRDDVAFVPLALPLRWSLVSTRLRAWQPNSRAWHPLNRLRPDTK